MPGLIYPPLGTDGSIVRTNEEITPDPLSSAQPGRSDKDAIVRHVNAEEALGNADTVTQEQCHRYWQLQRSLAAVTTNAMSYQQACGFLSLDAQKPILPGTKDVVLKPWQMPFGKAHTEDVQCIPHENSIPYRSTIGALRERPYGTQGIRRRNSTMELDELIDRLTLPHPQQRGGPSL